MMMAAAHGRSAHRDVVGSYDLHAHSTFSDGSKGVAELVREAWEAGLAGLAVTDHDSLSQLSEVREVARAFGLPVLAGVEVSAWNPGTGRKVHVLGYGLEATADGSGPLERIVAETLAARTANSLWQAWAIARSGWRELDLGRVARVAGRSTAVYKQHVMEALCGQAYTERDYQALYRSLFKGCGVAARDIAYPAATDVVRAIREQGGVAVLAHPGQMDSWSAVAELVGEGLQGIEAFHPDHDEKDEERALGVAGEFGLFVTGGSDFHGRYGAPACLGERFVTPEEAGERVVELFSAEAGLR
ncbi:PHP domain-containing protein [Thermophilibacter provencensis]|uniref:PHP domain-containing protein n=1 Tax=Thermophilibacter provencensis TaxID=1852386 RepID=A0A921GEH0_9ACTN|nr:PHP domain-containing protein [Thermophilibacter provencensis]HJF44750.1 PHP domain-containing protein [Thermophilibacter provencensis]